MSLGLPSQSAGGSNEIEDRIEYDARAGRWFKVDRAQNAEGEWKSNKEEIPLASCQFAMDLGVVHVGWIKFSPPPDFQLVPIGAQIPPRPGGLDDKGRAAYKSGFRMRLYNKQIGTRVWAHSARCVIEQVDALHTAFLAEQPKHPNELPIVACTHTVPIKSGQSTNYAPIMAIVSWIARPEGFTPGKAATAPTATAPATNGNGAAKPNGAVHMTPPGAAAPPAQAAAEGAKAALF